MFEILVVAVAVGILMAVLLMLQVAYAVMLKALHPKASWKRCFKKAGF